MTVLIDQWTRLEGAGLAWVGAHAAQLPAHADRVQGGG